MDNRLPRLLIVSNECLSQKNSNGRTLRNFLLGWPKDKLAQFYIRNGVPDFGVCERYFCVTDGQALRAMLGKRIGSGIVKMEMQSEEATIDESRHVAKTYGRNALTMLAREAAWASGAWKKYGFSEWVREYEPEVILLQAGDCGFMFELAVLLSKQYNAPLVIYNSEGYYFKDFDYFRASGFAHACYPIFRANLRRKTEKAIKRASQSVYICEELEREYWEVFHAPSTTIYTATEIRPSEAVRKNASFKAAYLGNLGVGRHEPLAEIANALHEISDELFLDVYGKIPNETVRKAFDDCPGLRYKGFVSYQEVQKIIAESDLIVHGESFSEFYCEDLKFAFSTKIADSLASGTCFLMYAPEKMASTRYLTDHQAAYVVSDPRKLRSTLKELVESEEARDRYKASADALVRKNHDAVANCRRFQKVIIEAFGGKG